MPDKALVIDANILIRAVLGQRVPRILDAHADRNSFFIPETVYVEAEEHLAGLVDKRGGGKGLATTNGCARDNYYLRLLSGVRS